MQRTLRILFAAILGMAVLANGIPYVLADTVVQDCWECHELLDESLQERY